MLYAITQTQIAIRSNAFLTDLQARLPPLPPLFADDLFRLSQEDLTIRAACQFRLKGNSSSTCLMLVNGLSGDE